MKPGKIIRLLRVSEGLPQAELADKLEVSRAYLSQVENGRKGPSLGFFKAVAKTFDVPLALLLAEENEPNSKVFSELRKILGDILAAKVASTARRG